jgi:hypothetical protein
MINGTAYVKVKETLTCLDKDCSGVLKMDDGNIAVGVFSEGKLRNLRCSRCRGPIKEVLQGFDTALAELKYEMS